MRLKKLLRPSHRQYSSFPPHYLYGKRLHPMRPKHLLVFFLILAACKKNSSIPTPPPTAGFTGIDPAK
jgi:hypothetical protein